MAREPQATQLPVDIESLKKRHKQLDVERTTAQANLNTAQKQLAELKDEARKVYGSDDLDALRKKLQEMRAENDRKLTDYQKHLQDVEAKLAEVNEKFTAG